LYDDLPVCAVSSPPPELVARVGEYDLDAMVAYEPRLLAKYPAELYTLDFDRAGLSAHSVIGKAMREKHGQATGDNVQVNISTSVREMSFQLALLPVWVGTLVEEDGDLRVALSTGERQSRTGEGGQLISGRLSAAGDSDCPLG
jgi:hypothetical protein